MPLRRMPNGEFVDLPEDITPEGYARVAASFKATTPPPSGAAPRTAPKLSADEQHVNEIKARHASKIRIPGTGGLDALQDNITHNMTLGLDDVVGPAMAAGTEGVVRAIQKKDIGEVGRTFRNQRTASQQMRDEAREENPVASGVGMGVGMVASPLGASTGLAKAATKGAQLATKYVPQSAKLVARAQKAAAAASASKVGKVIAKAGTTPIGLGARAGMNQGAVIGAVNDADSAGDRIENIKNEALMGGVFGAAGGAAMQGGKAIGRTILDRTPENAKRVAMDKIAGLLARSENPDTLKAFTPANIVNEIKATDKGGGNAIVADLMPEAQGYASHLAKQGTAASNRMINDSAERSAGSELRFTEKVRKVLGIKGSADSYDTVKGIKQARTVAGQEGFTDDVMDKQLVWSDTLDDMMTRPTTLKAVTQARNKMLDDGKDPTALAFDPDGGMMKVPSMGAMQHVTQTLDDDIGEAMRVGRRGDAQRLHKLNRTIKDEIAKLNPEFAEANAIQRDLFEQENSVKLGLTVLNQIRLGKSREVLDAMRSPTVKADDLKIGLADAFMDLHRKSGGGVAAMRAMVRQPAQRAALAHVLGSRKALADFEKFLRREMRGMETDAGIMSGRQMSKDLLKDPGDQGASEAALDTIKSVGTGLAFGGPLGAATRGTRQLNMWSKTMSRHAKEELANTLGGKGQDLKRGIQRSEAYKRILARRDARAAVLAGKAPGVVVNGYSEQ